MAYSIRKANQPDVPQLEKLFIAYMRETYQAMWGGNVERLEQDVSNDTLEIFVAESAERRIVGFIAWTPTYDLHWCLKGGDVIDFYVVPEKRGRGVGLLLAIEAAKEIQRHGGVFLKGGAVDDSVVRRFYGRFAMCLEGGESYVSGRAFRRLASLSGGSLREIVKNLPLPDWNYQP